MQSFDVLIRPILSEKSTDLREWNGQYAFEVKPKATKDDVKKAIVAMWDVKVKEVRTLVRRGKAKRRGNFLSQPKLTKHAYVTLEAGQKLPIFEDQ
ncbi:MAG: 50S ribosomal protein L23 [Oligoflexales bacterium]